MGETFLKFDSSGDVVLQSWSNSVSDVVDIMQQAERNTQRQRIYDNVERRVLNQELEGQLRPTWLPGLEWGRNDNYVTPFDFKTRTLGHCIDLAILHGRGLRFTPDGGGQGIHMTGHCEVGHGASHFWYNHG